MAEVTKTGAVQTQVLIRGDASRFIGDQNLIYPSRRNNAVLCHAYLVIVYFKLC